MEPLCYPPHPHRPNASNHAGLEPANAYLSIGNAKFIVAHAPSTYSILAMVNTKFITVNAQSQIPNADFCIASTKFTVNVNVILSAQTLVVHSTGARNSQTEEGQSLLAPLCVLIVLLGLFFYGFIHQDPTKDEDTLRRRSPTKSQPGEVQSPSQDELQENKFPGDDASCARGT